MTGGEINNRQPTGVTLERVTLSHLAQIRNVVTNLAGRAGIDDERAAHFVIAVNEVVINAIQHGGGAASVTATVVGRKLVVDVRDRGPGLASAPAIARPPDPDSVHGRGLWLAGQLSDNLEVVDSAAGTHVRLTAAAHN